jgi:outer membrane protein assembly factor BamA
MAYYGTGMASPDVRTDFAFRTTNVGADLRLEAARHVAVGGSFDVLDVSARHDLSPAAQTPTYGLSNLFAEFDTRTSPGYTRRGSLVRADLFDYRQMNDGASSFRRLDLDVRQYVPLLRENWVIAVRALASTTSTSAGNEVPYFLLPDLGGSKTLRGYSTWRFRDKNRVLFSGEWRWTAGSFVDMALFVDAGTVAPRVADLQWGDMKRSYGIGASFHTFTRTVTRLELSRTSDGTSLGISFSPNF